MIGAHKLSKSVENDIQLLRPVGKEKTCMWTIDCIYPYGYSTPYPGGAGTYIVHYHCIYDVDQTRSREGIRDSFPGCHRHSNRTSFGQAVKAALIVSDWFLTMDGVGSREGRSEGGIKRHSVEDSGMANIGLSQGVKGHQGCQGSEELVSVNRRGGPWRRSEVGMSQLTTSESCDSQPMKCEKGPS
jgi:hypothetical protein